MKNFIKKYKEYKYKKRLGKWFSISLKLTGRKIKRTLKSDAFKKSLVSSHAVIGCLSVLSLVAVSVCIFMFVKYTAPYFDSDSKILRRLSINGLTNDIPYLEALDSLGSTNRIQVTVKTENENYLNPKGTSLEKGSVNLEIVFRDGTAKEYALNNSNFSNFDGGVTDTFTLILPFGYTPFDIEEYSLSVLPDIKNDYGSWHCTWARVYFLLGNKPVILAKENWEGTALLGSGEGAVKKTTLKTVSDENESFARSEKLFGYYLELKSAGLENLSDEEVKSDVLDSLGINGGKFLYINIETANIELQNYMLTYYTKGVEISEQDALDYDGLMYLDVEFYSPLEDGSFTKSFLLDTLGTDDFELGTTCSFKLEMPEGMCVFDISSITLRAENPHDSWAPRYIRVYIKPDYTDILEIARLNDNMLISSYSTPVFYKNLIDTGIEFDLNTKFKISDITRKQLEKADHFSLGGKISSMYFDLQSFYERQTSFWQQMVDIYSKSAYEETEETA